MRFMSRKGKTDLIRKIPLFSECSRAELEAVATVADELHLPAGRVLIQQGDVGRELFVLVDGKVEVEQDGKPIGTRSSGDFLGEIAVVTRRPRTATVTALTDVRVLVLTDLNFKRLLADVPSISVKVLKALGDRLAPETV
jgi:CRP/FNR family transcriptional regulator, cyclic AMP receptor protein